MTKGTYNRPSRETVVNTLRTLFPKTEMTQEEIIAAADRTEMDAALNEGWLATKKTAFYYYSLVAPVYTTHNGKRKLKSLRLTSEGVKSLGRIDNGASSDDSGSKQTPPGNSGMQYTDIVRAVAAFKRDNPEYEVEFAVKLKEVLPTK